MKELVKGWKRLRNVELHNLYASPNFIRKIMSRRTGWPGHVARMREMHVIFWLKTMKGRDHSEDQGVYRKIN
jgi:hypothetical protein